MRRKWNTARRWRSIKSWPTHDPSVTGLRAELANSHLDLGILLSQTGRPAESEAEERKAIALYQKLSDDNPKAPATGLASQALCTTSAT